MDEMAGEERQRRADAERNRRRLLDAAATLFTERGLDVSVGEIAERAGVGRGTLFRNFPTKEHLIAAIIAQRMRDQVAQGRELLDADDPGEALFGYLEKLVGLQQVNRDLFEAVADEFLANEQIRAAYDEFVHMLDELITRAQSAGAIRPDVGAMDVLMLTKGVCQAATAFQHVDPEISERQFDLVRAALSSAGPALRGRKPTIEDVERAHTAAPPADPGRRAVAG
jgi:AcrR family transcriptional regulator